MDQQRFLDILLDDAVALATLTPFVLCRATIIDHMCLDLVKIIKYFDTIASISRLAWFKYPKLVRLTCGFESFELRVKFKV